MLFCVRRKTKCVLFQSHGSVRLNLNGNSFIQNGDCMRKDEVCPSSTSILRIMTGFLHVWKGISVFCAAWAMPAINKQIGYGNLCKQALALSKEHNITDFRTWRLHRSSNVDVYLESPVTVIEGDSLPQTNSGAPYLLLTRQKELSATGSRDYRVAGPYAVAVILPPR